MHQQAPRRYAVPFALGATAIGGLEAARIGGGAGLGLAIVPVFAATGLAIGALVAVLARVVEPRRWWVAALVLAAPAAAVAIPVGATLFDGAYAQTLPGVHAMPVVVPIVAWLVAAAAIAGGRRLVAGSQIDRAIVLLVACGALGGIVWLERHVLRAGYPDAHAGATVAVIALAGAAISAIWRGAMRGELVAALAGIVLGTAAASATTGLASQDDRLRLATFGDQARDLVRLWRGAIDFDRDGASPILGGGDCDDFDASRYPGARDIPGDGIDQDCDGVDAVAEPEPVAVAPDAAGAERAAEAALVHRTHDMSVVILSIDALRFDLLAPGAASRDDFPALARFLDGSAWFPHAIAPASSTDVSLCAMLTGRYDPYRPIATTLIEAMKLSGRRTTAAIPGEVTRYVGDTLIFRGVEHPIAIRTDLAVPDVGDHVSAPETTGAGLHALDDAAGKPTFIWLHYFDVHEHHQIAVAPALLAQVHDASPGPQGRRYRALLHAIDAEIARFLVELDRRGLADRTIVVLVGDHGENLDDPRAPDTHGKVAYGPLVRIPFAIRVPGVAAARHDDAVTMADVMPTVLALVGESARAGQMDGTSLVPALAGGRATDAARPIAIHEEDQWSIVAWPYQLVVRPADNTSELYDLDRDPGEHAPLAQPDVAARLKAAYARFPDVRVDRTPAGRAWRESRAQPPPPRAQP